MEITKEQLDNFVTKEDLRQFGKRFEDHIDYKFDHQMEVMGVNLSRQITREVVDTYWKIVPLMIGLMTLVNGVFFIAYKLS